MIHPSTLLRLMTFVGLGLFARAIVREAAGDRAERPRLPAPEPQPKRRRRTAAATDAETVG